MNRRQHNRLRRFGGDFTPTPAVRQLMSYLAHRDIWPQQHLDPCAGAGVFSACVRETFPSCRSHALEIREEEQRHLVNNAHDYVFRDCIEVLREKPPFLLEWAPLGFDLIATNAAFFLIKQHLIPLCLSAMSKGGLLVLLGSDDWGQRGLDMWSTWQEFTPCSQLRIAGTLRFRSGVNPETGNHYSVDFRSYSWWIWKADGKGGCGNRKSWVCEDLPFLPSKSRCWDEVRPGEEYLHG